MSQKLCVKCGKRPQRLYSQLCGQCWYADNYNFTLAQDPDSRDWGWAVCEECGSSLGSDGECRNTSCGASPDVGEDWY